MLKKFDPSLTQILKANRRRESILKRERQAAAERDGEEPVDMTPFTYNEPALRLGKKGQEVLYSDKSLARLAVNDSSNLVEPGSEEGPPKKIRNTGFMPKAQWRL